MRSVLASLFMPNGPTSVGDENLLDSHGYPGLGRITVQEWFEGEDVVQYELVLQNARFACTLDLVFEGEDDVFTLFEVSLVLRCRGCTGPLDLIEFSRARQALTYSLACQSCGAPTATRVESDKILLNPDTPQDKVEARRILESWAGLAAMNVLQFEIFVSDFFADLERIFVHLTTAANGPR